MAEYLERLVKLVPPNDSSGRFSAVQLAQSEYQRQLALAIQNTRKK
jgi:hypothetical protein